MPFDVGRIDEVRQRIQQTTTADLRQQMNQLREEVRPLASAVKVIKPRTTTSIAIVASDAGNNRLLFDPFEIQFVRVVDSYGQELCMDAVSPWTDPKELSRKQFDAGGKPVTPLGTLMNDLGVRDLGGREGLSPMIPAERPKPEESTKRSWVLVYRDLCEWAVLYDRLVNSTFATDTLLVRDGLLRSKIFSRDLFIKLCDRIRERTEEIYRKSRRRVFFVGVAKTSKVIDRYWLAMTLERIFPDESPCYVAIPQKLEERAYEWPEYARREEGGGELPKFVAGSLYLVRFGSRRWDPVWPIDVFSAHSAFADDIFGYLLEDSRAGFPVPYYPLCLQRADEFAQVRDLDVDILQQAIYSSIRDGLPDELRPILDATRLKSDVAGRRY
jgi:hypothetical protein